MEELLTAIGTARGIAGETDPKWEVRFKVSLLDLGVSGSILMLNSLCDKVVLEVSYKETPFIGLLRTKRFSYHWFLYYLCCLLISKASIL